MTFKFTKKENVVVGSWRFKDLGYAFCNSFMKKMLLRYATGGRWYIWIHLNGIILLLAKTRSWIKQTFLFPNMDAIENQLVDSGLRRGSVGAKRVLIIFLINLVAHAWNALLDVARDLWRATRSLVHEFDSCAFEILRTDQIGPLNYELQLGVRFRNPAVGASIGHVDFPNVLENVTRVPPLTVCSRSGTFVKTFAAARKRGQQLASLGVRAKIFPRWGRDSAEDKHWSDCLAYATVGGWIVSFHRVSVRCRCINKVLCSNLT